MVSGGGREGGGRATGRGGRKLVSMQAEDGDRASREQGTGQEAEVELWVGTSEENSSLSSGAGQTQMGTGDR